MKVAGAALAIFAVLVARALPAAQQCEPVACPVCVVDVDQVEGSLDQVLINQANLMVALGTFQNECSSVMEHMTAIEVVPLPVSMR